MARNLLMLHTHDMGRYNAAHGHALPTPCMAQLAHEGFLFRNAHCAAPTCSPSRAALLTGKTAHETGMFGLVHRGWDMRDYHEHLAAHLGKQGWHTAWAGVQHEFKDVSRAPYAENIESRWRGPWGRDQATANAAAHWLREESHEQPFFLWAGFFLPHVPFVPADPKRFPPGQMQPPPTLPDTPQTRQDWADYAASIERTDQCIGQILDALREGGHAEDTLVILTTDHGVPLPHMKCNLTAHGTGVSLMMRGPGIPAGGVSDRLVSHLDVFPSVCDWLEAEIPPGLHGSSVRPHVEGRVDSIREDAFAEVTYHAAYQPMRAVRTERWNYILSFDDDRRRPLANVDKSRSKNLLMSHDYANRPTADKALYDLVYDPQETHNLAYDPAHAEIKKEMAQRLERWLESTDDPIRHGPVPLCADASCNTRESIDPHIAP